MVVQREVDVQGRGRGLGHPRICRQRQPRTQRACQRRTREFPNRSSKGGVEVGGARPETAASASNAKSKSRPRRASSTSKGAGTGTRARIPVVNVSSAHEVHADDAPGGSLAHPPRPPSRRTNERRRAGVLGSRRTNDRQACACHVVTPRTNVQQRERCANELRGQGRGPCEHARGGRRLPRHPHGRRAHAGSASKSVRRGGVGGGRVQGRVDEAASNGKGTGEGACARIPVVKVSNARCRGC